MLAARRRREETEARAFANQFVEPGDQLLAVAYGKIDGPLSANGPPSVDSPVEIGASVLDVALLFHEIYSAELLALGVTDRSFFVCRRKIGRSWELGFSTPRHRVRLLKWRKGILQDTMVIDVAGAEMKVVWPTTPRPQMLDTLQALVEAIRLNGD